MASFSSSKQHAILLLLLIVGISANLSPAKGENPPNVPIPLAYGIFQVKQCLRALPGIYGVCTSDVLRYLEGPQNGIISQSCCRAVFEIVDKCRLTSLPFDPIFPPLVLGVCAGNRGDIESFQP